MLNVQPIFLFFFTHLFASLTVFFFPFLFLNCQRPPWRPMQICQDTSFFFTRAGFPIAPMRGQTKPNKIVIYLFLTAPEQWPDFHNFQSQRVVKATPSVASTQLMKLLRGHERMLINAGPVFPGPLKRLTVGASFNLSL